MCLVPKQTSLLIFSEHLHKSWIHGFVVPVHSFVRSYVRPAHSDKGPLQWQTVGKISAVKKDVSRYISRPLSRWWGPQATSLYVFALLQAISPPQPTNYQPFPHHQSHRHLNKPCSLKPSSEPLPPLCPWLVPWWPERWPPPLPHKLVL